MAKLVKKSNFENLSYCQKTTAKHHCRSTVTFTLAKRLYDKAGYCQGGQWDLPSVLVFTLSVRAPRGALKTGQ